MLFNSDWLACPILSNVHNQSQTPGECLTFRSGNILRPSRNRTYTRSTVLNASNCLLHVSPKTPPAQILESVRLLTLVRVQKSVPNSTYSTRVLLPYPLLTSTPWFLLSRKNQKFQIQLTHAPIHSSVLCSKIHQIRHKNFHKKFVQNSIPFPWVQVYGRQCYIFPGTLFPFMPKCLWNPPNFRAVSNKWCIFQFTVRPLFPPFAEPFPQSPWFSILRK